MMSGATETVVASQIRVYGLPLYTNVNMYPHFPFRSPLGNYSGQLLKN